MRRHTDEMLPWRAMCGWGVRRKGNLRPVSLFSHPCRWWGEDPPCPRRWTGGLPASAPPGGELGRRPSICAPLSTINDLLVADENLSLSCLMIEKCVTPSPTIPCNMPGAGGCPWHWQTLSYDWKWQWKTLAFHPGTKVTEKLWFFPPAKNGCG